LPDISEPRRGAGTAGRVLLAEDNPINQRVGAAMLTHLGFSVDIAADGSEAVRAAASTRYRAIFMDCQLPVVDGCAATGEIRRAQGPHRHTLIIALTGSASAVDRDHCLAAGMDDYLAKPFSLKSLAAMLARWLPQEPLTSSLEALPADGTAGEVDPSPSAGTGRPALDELVIARLEGLGATLGENLVGQLATLFLTEADTRLDQLHKAITADDADLILRLAHTLSGSSANMGAAELATQCAALATTSGDRDSRTAMLGSIEAELVRVRSALLPLVATA
jgi:two-component system, sensor histidine kinase and response regulator